MTYAAMVPPPPLLTTTVAVACQTVGFDVVVGRDSVMTATCLFVPDVLVIRPPPPRALPVVQLAVAENVLPTAELPAMLVGVAVETTVVLPTTPGAPLHA